MNTPYKNPIRILAIIGLILSIFMVRSTVAGMSDHMPPAIPIITGLLIVIRGICIIFIFVDKKRAAICLLSTALLMVLNALLLTHYLFVPAFVTDILLGIAALMAVRKSLATGTNA